MAEKDWKQRWNDTIKYLDKVTTVGHVGTHINNIVPGDQKRMEISEQLSLGMRLNPFGEDKRHALRALLLCQRVYFCGDTWAKTAQAYGDMETIGLVPFTYLDLNTWKDRSLQFWGGKSELQVRDGIRMFEPTAGANQAKLKEVAFKGKPNNKSVPGDLFLSRTDPDTPGAGFTCYVGVQNWMLKSGLTSLRWYMQNANPNGKIGCDLLFGPGRFVWNAPILTPEDERAVRRQCNAVEPGHMVHIWTPDNRTWNGHWLVANGDGTACGVNNGELRADQAEKGIVVPKPYTRTTTLFEQFMGYSEIGEPPMRRKTTKACMTVHDPDLIVRL